MIGIYLHGIEGSIEVGDFVPGWLKTYDADRYEGRGFVEVGSAAEAIGFEDFAEAMACYRRQSRTRPYRDDGLPNTPLTAFTVAFLALPGNPPVPGITLTRAGIFDAATGETIWGDPPGPFPLR